MPTVREFFVAEANDYLRRLDAALRVAAANIDARELQRIARGLRGSAQMAREDRVQRVAQVLETAARALDSAVLSWGPAVQQMVSDTYATLQRLVAGDPNPDTRAQSIVERWRDLGLAIADSVAAAARPADADARLRELRTWAAREAGGIMTELNTLLAVLPVDPTDREPLKSLLRRQRALLGASQLEAIPVAHQTLTALDEVTRLIARLNVPVIGEWIEPYRLGRDVLGAAIPPLQRQEDPPASPALAALRQAHEKLMERHGGQSQPTVPEAGQPQPADVMAMFRKEAATLLTRIERMSGELAAAPAHRQAEVRRELRAALSAIRDTARTFGFPEAGDAAERGLARASSGGALEMLTVVSDLREIVGEPGAAAATAEANVVPIETLLYRGEVALQRALELEPQLQATAGSRRETAETLAEVFDLIRLSFE